MKKNNAMVYSVTSVGNDARFGLLHPARRERNRFRNVLHSLLGVLTLLCITSLWGDGLNEIHPGYTFSKIHPDEPEFLVSGLEMLSNGDLVICNWGNPGDIWIMENPGGEDRTLRRFAKGLNQSLGCRVVDDTIYSLQMGELTQLMDSDGNGEADQYNKVNDAFPTSESLLIYAFDVIHYGNAFYAALSADVMAGGYTAKPPMPGRSMWIKLNRDNTMENLASGFRNPDGMALVWGNKMLTIDSQGSWKPTCQIIHLEPGKFYGHVTDPPNLWQDQPHAPVAIWMPYPEVSKSPGNIVEIKNGAYKGQLFYFEQDWAPGGRVYRVNMEMVDGTMQGAIMPFCGNIRGSRNNTEACGVHRGYLTEDGTIYLGMLGTSGSWDKVQGMRPGLNRLIPKDNDAFHAFEVLAVRSTGSSTMELEFTRPVGNNAGQANSYSARTYTFEPVENYGGGNKTDDHPLGINSASVSGDGLKVTLNLTGLEQGYLLEINLSVVRSQTGEPPWTPRVWYMINKFGPGYPVPVAACNDPDYLEYDPTAGEEDNNLCKTLDVRKVDENRFRGISLEHSAAGGATLAVPFTGTYRLELFNVAGRKVYENPGQGPDEIDLRKTSLTEGMYVIRLEWQGRVFSRRAVLF